MLCRRKSARCSENMENMLTEERTVSPKRKFDVLKVYKTEHPERLNSYFQGKPEGGNI